MSFIELTEKEIDTLNSTEMVRDIGYIDNDPTEKYGKIFYNMKSNRGKTVCPFSRYSHKKASQYIYFDSRFGSYTIKCRHSDCKHKQIRKDMIHYKPETCRIPYIEF